MLDVVDQIVHGTDRERRLDVAMEIDDLALGGFAHPHIVDFAKTVRACGERGKRRANFGDARGVGVVAGDERGRQRLYMGFDFDFGAELLAEFDLALSDVAFAARLAEGEDLREAVEEWLSAAAHKPDDVTTDGWLRFEQDKHERLLAAAGRRSNELELMERR